MPGDRRYKLIVFAAGLNCLLAGGLHAQSANSQQLKIPERPTRELDPRFRFHDDQAASLATRQAVAAQNEKRRQLIVWAANELVVLSVRADKDATSSVGEPSKADLAAEVGRIEALAKNLAIVIKAQ